MTSSQQAILALCGMVTVGFIAFLITVAFVSSKGNKNK